MADRAISELTDATQILAGDMFVLEQNGVAKKLQGQVLLSWLTKAADGHGGIKSIAKTKSSGLVDTYTITMADTTVATFTVTNGAKGDKGDNSYVHIKYASHEPTSSSHDMGNYPDNWIGIYSGNSSTAPTSWTSYKWFQFKGEKGDTGSPAVIQSQVVEYQEGESGTAIPSGVWLSTIPEVRQGHYLWTRTTQIWNSGNPQVSYSVGRMGLDGTGAVSAVAGKTPDASGNVVLSLADIPPSLLDMKQNRITNLGSPLNNGDAATRGYVDTKDSSRKAYVDSELKKASGIRANLLHNAYFPHPVNQRGVEGTITVDADGHSIGTDGQIADSGYFLDRWKIKSGSVTVSPSGLLLNGTIIQILEHPVTGTVKASYLASDGVHDAAYDASTGTFTLTASNVLIIAAKLELGSVQTLGMLDGSTWRVTEIPDYGAELLECQRFYFNSSGAPVMNGLLTEARQMLRFCVPMPIAPRVPWTLVNANASSLRTVNGNGSISYIKKYKAGSRKGEACPEKNLCIANGTVLLLEFNIEPLPDSVTNNSPISAYVSLEVTAEL